MFWWEVQLDDNRDIPNINADCYIAICNPIDVEEADLDEHGNPCESAHFIENTAFVVVMTVDDNPRSAIMRALGRLSPNDRKKAREEGVWWPV